MDNMTIVDERDFLRKIKGRKLSTRMGNTFHSTIYTNEFGIDIAYMETSSWGADEIYMVLINESDVNSLTTNFVTNILNK